MTAKHLLRAIAAIVVGIVSGAALSIATDALMEATGIFPPFSTQMNGVLLTTSQLILATIYRCIYTVLSCYLGALVAPSRPMRYAIALGIIATLANLGGLSMVPDPSQIWYPVTLAVLSLPCAWLGGTLYGTKKA